MQDCVATASTTVPVEPIAKPDKPTPATLHCYHKHRYRHAAPDGRLFLNCHKCDGPDQIIWVNLKSLPDGTFKDLTSLFGSTSNLNAFVDQFDVVDSGSEYTVSCHALFSIIRFFQFLPVV